jgi:preprotein translocase subunit SecB
VPPDRPIRTAPETHQNHRESKTDMADETTPAFTPETLSNGEDNSPAIGLISQYVKDLSFENPNAPAIYQVQEAPQVDVQFNIGADNVGDGLFEVSLKIDVTSKNAELVGFVVELKYAGLFGVRNVPDDQLQPFFLAEAPRILFPFARRIVADVVRDGGFPPLLLEPIDFHGLFQQQAAQIAAEQAGDIAPVGQA